MVNSNVFDRFIYISHDAFDDIPLINGETDPLLSGELLSFLFIIVSDIHICFPFELLDLQHFEIV